MAHLETTVHWMNNVQTLWNDYGIRLFAEVGPGDILSNLIADTLPQPLCLQTCLPTVESHTYRTALAQFFVHGHLRALGEPRFVSLPASRKAPASQGHPVEERSSRALDRPPATPDGQAGPALAEAPERQDHLEAIIRIIMDATGFDRDEIQPDMDLKRNLSIRSSRMPIIMDAAERYFGITIELEDFIHVRTVRDIAQRISAIVARQEGAGERPAKVADPGAAPAGIPEPSADEVPLNRLVSNLTPLEPTAPINAPASQGHAPVGERSFRALDRPPATPDGQAAPALTETPERQDHLEAIIRIIMDATGFDRDEIQPDMDLKRNLSIRSSRMPIIMDAAERYFGITIELEDFIHVRTVRDIAQRISAIVARQEGAGERPAKAADPGAVPAGIPEPSADEAPLKRLVFNLAPLEPTASMPRN